MHSDCTDDGLDRLIDRAVALRPDLTFSLHAPSPPGGTWKALMVGVGGADLTWCEGEIAEYAVRKLIMEIEMPKKLDDQTIPKHKPNPTRYEVLNMAAGSLGGVVIEWTAETDGEVDENEMERRRAVASVCITLTRLCERIVEEETAVGLDELDPPED